MPHSSTFATATRFPLDDTALETIWSTGETAVIIDNNTWVKGGNTLDVRIPVVAL